MLEPCPICGETELLELLICPTLNDCKRAYVTCRRCGFTVEGKEVPPGFVSWARIMAMVSWNMATYDKQEEYKGVTQMLQCPKCGSQNCKGNAKDYIAYCCDCGKTGEWGDFKPNTEEPKKETASGLSADQEEFLLAFDNFCKEHNIISVDVNVHGNITFEKLGYENDTLSFQRYHKHEGFDNISVVQRIDIKHFYTNPEAKKLDEEYGFTF